MADELFTLQLPLLRGKDVRARAETLGNPDFLNVELLEWLWNIVAGPVVDALGFADTLRRGLPRIWWVPTGPLAKFPINAAGRYPGSTTETVLDQTISCYSSSVRALLWSHPANQIDHLGRT